MHAAAALQRRASPRSSATSRPAARASTARCSTPRPEIRTGRARRDHRRPRSVRRVQLVGDPRRRGRDARARRSSGRDYALIVVGRKAEGYFRYRDYRIDASFTGFTRPARRYEDAREIGRGGRRSAFLAGEVDLVELVYTRFVVGRHARRSCAGRSMPLERDERRRRRRPPRRADGGAGRPTSSSRARRDPRPRCCRATSRPASTPRC